MDACQHDIDPLTKLCRKCGLSKWMIIVKGSLDRYLRGEIATSGDDDDDEADTPVIVQRKDGK